MDFGLLFFGVLFPAFALVGAVHMRKAWLIGSVGTCWPSVTGRITESRFEPDDDSYKLIIEYEYVVNQAQFQGDIYSYRGYSTDLESVKNIISQYPVDHDVNVFYDPMKPKTSLLVPGVDKNAYIVGGISLFVLLLVGIICLVCAFRSFRMAG